jgi:hypothetical protein
MAIIMEPSMWHVNVIPLKSMKRKLIGLTKYVNIAEKMNKNLVRDTKPNTNTKKHNSILM